MVKKREDAEKEAYKVALEKQREEQKAFEAHLRFDEESRKADEKKVADEKKLQEERVKFHQEAEALIFKSSREAAEQEERVMDAHNKVLVKQILELAAVKREMGD